MPTRPKTPEERSLLARFGERVREVRLQRGLRQSDFQAINGMTRTYISHIERGSRNLALVRALRVAKALDVELADLMEGIRLQ